MKKNIAMQILALATSVFGSSADRGAGLRFKTARELRSPAEHERLQWEAQRRRHKKAMFRLKQSIGKRAFEDEIRGFV